MNEEWYKKKLIDQQKVIDKQQEHINKLNNKVKVDAYKVLNISKNHTILELKKAYLEK